jgi:hypothetical protein
MARATRTVFLAIALVTTLLLAPAAAHAEVLALTQLEFPATVKAGQTTVGTIALANLNGPALAAFGLKAAGDQTVCNAGDVAPCSGPGIVLTPSCSEEAEGA